MENHSDGQLKRYRFRTVEQAGVVKLHDDRVECLVRSGFLRWQYEVRYQDLVSAPVRIWQTPATCWLCLLVGAAGVVASTIRLVGLDFSLPMFLAVPILVLSVFILTIAWRSKREEWMSIPSASPELRVFFCRQGPDATQFEEFSAELCQRILSAESWSNSKPKI